MFIMPCMVHLKYNNLNIADAEIIENTGSDRSLICMFFCYYVWS